MESRRLHSTRLVTSTGMDTPSGPCATAACRGTRGPSLRPATASCGWPPTSASSGSTASGSPRGSRRPVRRCPASPSGCSRRGTAACGSARTEGWRAGTTACSRPMVSSTVSWFPRSWKIATEPCGPAPTAGGPARDSARFRARPSTATATRVRWGVSFSPSTKTRAANSGSGRPLACGAGGRRR